MAEFPAHASPALPPLASPNPDSHPHHFQLHHDPAQDHLHSQSNGAPPLVTPHITPPLTPNGEHVDHASAQPTRTATDPSSSSPQLLETLPEVWCQVRARIPTTTGQEMFLHLYHNSADNKEHLAIVFGPHIRSRSLDVPRPGETERDRMIRGAYTGTLFPGRTSSRRVAELRREAGVDEHDDDEARQRNRLGPALVRIHSECYTGETVWSARCDCGEQLDEAARLMSGLCTDADATDLPPHPDHPSLAQPSAGGVIVYLRQEGRGIGLLSKLKAYNLQDLGADTMQANLLLRHPADARSYGLATAMLLDLGVGGDKGVRLLTNNPEKVRAVEGPGREVRVVERVPMIPVAWRTGGKKGVRGKEVEKYISTKVSGGDEMVVREHLADSWFCRLKSSNTCSASEQHGPGRALQKRLLSRGHAVNQGPSNRNWGAYKAGLHSNCIIYINPSPPLVELRERGTSTLGLGNTPLLSHDQRAVIHSLEVHLPARLRFRLLSLLLLLALGASGAIQSSAMAPSAVLTTGSGLASAAPSKQIWTTLFSSPA